MAITEDPVRQAVFLVGGKGTRLGQLTQATPKPLLEIAPGLRFLDVVLEEAARHGFADILLLAGYLGDQVEAAYQGRRIYDARVTVLREPEPQGTGGALRFAADKLDPWFLMGNGDSLFEINLRTLAMARDDNFDARLALREVQEPARYGAVALNDGRITQFLEKNPSLKGPALINGGLYLMRRDGVMPYVNGPCSIEQDVFPRLAEAGRLQGQAFEGYFLDMGLPDTYAQAQAETPLRRKRPAAFLDRDGTINLDKGYTYKLEDLVFVRGAPEAIRTLNDAGYYVIVVSNQAGIARGYYKENDVDNFHAEMAAALAEKGAHIDAFYYCPYHADAAIETYRNPDHPERKPNPGMLKRAMSDWPIRKEGSFMLGDQESDVAAGRALDLDAYLFESGDLEQTVRAILSQYK